MITALTDWILDLFNKLFRHTDPIVQITSAVPSGAGAHWARLQLTFSNGDKGEIDLSRHVQFLGVLVPLTDPAFFRRVFIHHGTICWPGEIDLDPIVMHHLTMGIPIDLVHPELAAPSGLPSVNHSPTPARTR